MNTFDSLEILRLMPQRYPMLLVDYMEMPADENRCVAFKNITLNEPCYRQIAQPAARNALAYPLALLAESFGQGAGMLLAQRGILEQDSQRSIVVFGEFADIEIADNAYPGDRLKHEIQIDFASPRMAQLSGTTWAADRLIATYRGVKVFRVPVTAFAGGAGDA
ncbi:3-hydroxyacyl-ACP dehydratase FabZ family protein [Paraburkholderia dilworthii]|uniref:3-hydroxyacyl-ACP dehydratase FabZ family protein n=1 Tax=Paraburkholderia dilworthii TaxID=948106 RepID=UPI0006844ECC|nr:hypothetical protein [Paraburkholderia dilworthii]